MVLARFDLNWLPLEAAAESPSAIGSRTQQGFEAGVQLRVQKRYNLRQFIDD